MTRFGPALIALVLAGAALPGPAAAFSLRHAFGLTRAHPPKAAGLGGEHHHFKPFHGFHTSSHRGGLDAYPHARRSHINTYG